MTDRRHPVPWAQAQAARLAYAGFFLIGWTAVLIPTLILAVERHFAESDSGIGVLYFISALSFVAGSLGGGPFVERVGRRASFPLSCLLVGGGLVAQAFAPAWLVFVLGSACQGLGAGLLEVCGNSLVIDSFPEGRSNALSRLHVFFALGALASPLASSGLAAAAVPWQGLLAGTGLAGCVLALLLLPQRMTSGRRPGPAPHGAQGERPERRVALPLGISLLAVSTALYVASEAGVSGWVVRYLAPRTLSLAPIALSLFWAGVAVGRMASARISHRFDPAGVVLASGVVGALLLVVAVTIPAHAAAVALFAAVGLAYGPIYPSLMTLASERYPRRSASVSGLIGTAAFAGQSMYPPVMGFLSPTLGLGVGMLGAAALVILSSAAARLARMFP